MSEVKHWLATGLMVVSLAQFALATHAVYASDLPTATYNVLCSIVAATWAMLIRMERRP